MLSQTAIYAIRALLCLQKSTCARRRTRDIALCAGIPPAYLAKVLRQLTDKGLLTASRGRGGGVVLARDAANISLAEICEAVDGPDWLPECLLGRFFCAEPRRCPMRRIWHPWRTRVRRQLRLITLAHCAESSRVKPVKSRRTEVEDLKENHP